MATTSSYNPHQVRPVLVEVQDQELVIVPDRDFDRDAKSDDWSGDIIRSCVGPFTSITVDLKHRPMISSLFFAGALRLLDHYRNDKLDAITLRGCSTRVARTVEMMNLGETFRISRS